MAAQSVAPTPARRDYKPEVKPVPLSALPFVCRPRCGFKNTSNWRVPPTDDLRPGLHDGRGVRRALRPVHKEQLLG